MRTSAGDDDVAHSTRSTQETLAMAWGGQDRLPGRKRPTGIHLSVQKVGFLITQLYAGLRETRGLMITPWGYLRVSKLRMPPGPNPMVVFINMFLCFIETQSICLLSSTAASELQWQG